MRSGYVLSTFQSMLLSMSHPNNSNVIIDPVLSISFLLFCWSEPSDPSSCSLKTEGAFKCLSFCMDKINWPRIMSVIAKMKMTSKQKEKTFIEEIEKFFNLHLYKLKSASENAPGNRGKTH